MKLTHLLLPFFTAALMAQDTESPKLAFGGSFFTDQRATVGGDAVQYSWQEYRLSFKSDYKVSGTAKFYSEAWVRSIGFPEISRLTDLQSITRTSPVELSLREAYVELYNCGIDKLDLKIGRQRIAWGTADKINPTDNFDAPDLEDIWEFGRHLASDALKATYYIGDFSITGVAVPWFTPAVLPKGKWLSALMPEQSISAELSSFAALGTITEHIEMPSHQPADCVSGGMKIGGRLGDYDLSLSYIYGRDHFPIVYRKVLKPVSADYSRLPVTLDVDAYLKYPRQQIAGIDFAGALGQVGVWAEAAVFFPEKISMTTEFGGRTPTLQDLAALPPVILQQLLALNRLTSTPSTALDDKPYVKFVIGVDYTFPANIYLNLQYIHGYAHERSDQLGDYLMGTVDWKLLDEKLVFTPIGIGLEVSDFSKLNTNYALIGQPELCWKPMDNAELSIGARIIAGTETTQFGRLKDNDELFAQVKYSF